MCNKRSLILMALVLAVTALVVESGRNCFKISFRKHKSKDKVEVKSEVKSGVTNEAKKVVRKPHHQIFSWTSKDVYSTKKLNKLLGYSMPGGSSELVDLLALTKDKDKRNAVLGKYRINEILDWNIYYPDDCTPDGMVKHRTKCAEINPDRVPLPDDSHLLELCHREQFALASAKVEMDMETLHEFTTNVERHTEDEEIKLHLDYNKLVRELLAKSTRSKAELVKSSCANMVSELTPFFENAKYLTRESYPKKYYNMCKAVVS